MGRGGGGGMWEEDREEGMKEEEDEEGRVEEEDRDLCYLTASFPFLSESLDWTMGWYQPY